MLPLALIMLNNNIAYIVMRTIHKKIEQVKDRMCQKFLKLNKNKTEIIVVRVKDERLKGDPTPWAPPQKKKKQDQK